MTMGWRETLMSRMLSIGKALQIDRLILDKLLRLNRRAYPFTDYFKGMEKSEAVRRIFGKETEETLRNLKVEFTYMGGYMWVNSVNGHLMVNPHYINNGDRIDIYLDIIHELVHIRQLMEGKELFDISYEYIDRPTEIEAYRHAIEEAKKLGLSEKRICEYLKTEWISCKDLKKLAKTLNIKCTPIS